MYVQSHLLILSWKRANLGAPEAKSTCGGTACHPGWCASVKHTRHSTSYGAGPPTLGPTPGLSSSSASSRLMLWFWFPPAGSCVGGAPDSARLASTSMGAGRPLVGGGGGGGTMPGIWRLNSGCESSRRLGARRTTRDPGRRERDSGCTPAFAVQASAFRISGWTKVQGMGYGVWSLGFGVKGLGFRIQGLGIWVYSGTSPIRKRPLP